MGSARRDHGGELLSATHNFALALGTGEIASKKLLRDFGHAQCDSAADLPRVGWSPSQEANAFGCATPKASVLVGLSTGAWSCPGDVENSSAAIPHR